MLVFGRAQVGVAGVADSVANLAIGALESAYKLDRVTCDVWL